MKIYVFIKCNGFHVDQVCIAAKYPWVAWDVLRKYVWDLDGWGLEVYPVDKLENGIILKGPL